MAIQQINLGSAPSGAGGDTQRAANTKINENFTNPEHAASRLVGNNAGNLLEVGTHGLGSTSTPINDYVYGDTLRNGFYTSGNKGIISYGQQWTTGYRGLLELPTDLASLNVTQVRVLATGDWTGKALNDPAMASKIVTVKLYSDRNTTKDSNGFIKASSPVLRVFSDHIEGNDDGEKMSAKFVKKGVGNYLIKGTTGLAEEGWKIELPQDDNKNPLVAVEINGLDNGDVSLKTYKRKFDFETVSIVADTDNPIDIPETRWIDLRFNEIEKDEVANEPIK